MDSSERKLDAKIAEKLVKLQSSSEKDALTGLYNQPYLAEHVDNYIEGGRNAGALFLINIDNFSSVNEKYGHIMGDACLVELAGVLKGSFREKDIAARLSGDEFGVFLTGKLTYKDIESIANKLMNASNDGFSSMNLEGDVTVSIGISNTPGNGYDFISLYRKAGEALRQVKKNGKNDFSVAEATPFDLQRVDTTADMNMVKSMITERHKPQGALKVEYEGFRHIYQFLARYSDRQQTAIEIVLFTLSKKDGRAVDPVTLSEAMFDLENVIKISLRIGDVATKYSSCQYLVMLIGARDSDTRHVADRIVKNYSSFAERYNVSLLFDSENVSMVESQQS